MIPGRKTLLATFLLTLVSSALCDAPRPEPGRQTAQEFRREVRTEHRLQYLLYVPKAAASEPARRWPLVLFLHGAGERGTNLNAVAVHGPPKLVAAGRNTGLRLLREDGWLKVRQGLTTVDEVLTCTAI